MGKGRLEAFSDGVMAVIITIMVLDLKPPHGQELSALMTQLPTFLTYVLSFIFIGIYWVNHHHFFHAVEKVSGGLLWANLHLLFWLSLIPFATAFMGENYFTSWPVAAYGFVLLACAVAYTLMTVVTLRGHAADSDIVRAVGDYRKDRISLAILVAAIPLAFWWPAASCALFVTVAAIWFIPDRRIERATGVSDS